MGIVKGSLTKFIDRYEKDVYTWFNTAVVKSLYKRVILYHKIQDSGNGKGNKKPFDSFFVYINKLSFFVGVEFKVVRTINPLNRYSLKSLRLEEHQISSLKDLARSGQLGLIIVNLWEMYEITEGVRKGTDSILIFNITEFDQNEYVIKKPCIRTSTNITIELLDVLEQYEKTIMERILNTKTNIPSK